MTNYQLVEYAIDVESIRELVSHPNCGACCLFIGTVREMTFGKKTLRLDYEAYPEMAQKQLEQIGQEIQRECPEARVAIAHRIGRLEISDIAVVIAVATPHREDSFRYSKYAIERIKEIVPIWKKEYWEDGEKWIGDQLEQESYPLGKPQIKE